MPSSGVTYSGDLNPPREVESDQHQEEGGRRYFRHPLSPGQGSLTREGALKHREPRWHRLRLHRELPAGSQPAAPSAGGHTDSGSAGGTHGSVCGVPDEPEPLPRVGERLSSARVTRCRSAPVAAPALPGGSPHSSGTAR